MTIDALRAGYGSRRSSSTSTTARPDGTFRALRIAAASCSMPCSARARSRSTIVGSGAAGGLDGRGVGPPHPPALRRRSRRGEPSRRARRCLLGPRARLARPSGVGADDRALKLLGIPLVGALGDEVRFRRPPRRPVGQRAQPLRHQAGRALEGVSRDGSRLGFRARRHPAPPLRSAREVDARGRRIKRFGGRGRLEFRGPFPRTSALGRHRRTGGSTSSVNGARSAR